MISRIVAGGDGQRVLGVFRSHNLHLLLVLQPQRRTLQTGQRQVVEFHLGLACSLQHQLTVIALTREFERELMTLIQALDFHMSTLDSHFHAVLNLLFDLGRFTFRTDGDVFCMANTTQHQE